MIAFNEFPSSESGYLALSSQCAEYDNDEQECPNYWVDPLPQPADLEGPPSCLEIPTARDIRSFDYNRSRAKKAAKWSKRLQQKQLSRLQRASLVDVSSKGRKHEGASGTKRTRERSSATLLLADSLGAYEHELIISTDIVHPLYPFLPSGTGVNVWPQPSDVIDGLDAYDHGLCNDFAAPAPPPYPFPPHSADMELLPEPVDWASVTCGHQGRCCSTCCDFDWWRSEPSHSSDSSEPMGHHQNWQYCDTFSHMPHRSKASLVIEGDEDLAACKHETCADPGSLSQPRIEAEPELLAEPVDWKGVFNEGIFYTLSRPGGRFCDTCSWSPSLETRMRAARRGPPADLYPERDPQFDPLFVTQSVSVARDVRSYEYSRSRVKSKARYLNRRAKLEHQLIYGGRGGKLKVKGKTGAQWRAGGIRMDSVEVNEDDEEDFSVPIDVSLSTIFSEDDSFAKPFSLSDILLQKEKPRRVKGMLNTPDVLNFLTPGICVEPGFEFVPRVRAVIALDDKPLIRDIDVEEVWEHVWGDELDDGWVV